MPSSGGYRHSGNVADEEVVIQWNVRLDCREENSAVVTLQCGSAENRDKQVIKVFYAILMNHTCRVFYDG